MGSASHSSKRRKKRSQKRSKKSSRSIKEKTKKLKRRYDSDSYSDDDSTSASLVSCSSSEVEYKRKRREKSRDRKDRKSRKKRTKKDDSMSESSEDSHRVKKRKRSKKNKDSDSRKKRRKKKRKREPSVSSLSDQSNSCPTGEPSDDSEREIGRKGKKLKIKERKGRDKSRERSVSKRSRHSSRSCSPFSLHSESQSYYSEERVIEKNHPKRLKSVIVCITGGEETELRESSRDSHKDEIVYEHDDYPSRSNDSNDFVSRKEELVDSDDARHENTRSLEDPKAVTSDVRTSEFSGSQSLDVERSGGATSNSVASGVSDHLKANRSDMSMPNTGSNRGDLEAILRQQALKNLLKRQSKLVTATTADEKNDPDGEAKLLSSVKNGNVWVKPEGVGSTKSEQIGGKNDDVQHTTSKQDNDVCPQIRNPETCLSTEKANAPGSVSGRPKLDLSKSTSTRRFLGSSNTWRRELPSQESPQPNLSIPKKVIATHSAKRSESLSVDTNMGVEKGECTLTSELSSSGEKSTKDETNEADDDSEFQQKTMSVMRGGELVQVSYKVKIPKKAPALARRQLKR